jgi:hypothetical protein
MQDVIQLFRIATSEFIQSNAETAASEGGLNFEALASAQGVCVLSASITAARTLVFVVCFLG